MRPRKMKIGIALGSGGARGWAHFGVLRALRERGIEPDVVAGTSIGALVGAAYASGQHEALEEWVRGIDRLAVLRLLDAGFSGGMIKGERVMRAVEDQIQDRNIEALPIKFAAIATELRSGREVWFRNGSMLAAARASCGMPGLFSPVEHDGEWLIDGGIVNPVPVSACKALGADLVIAVNLNGHLVQRRFRSPKEQRQLASNEDRVSPMGRLRVFFDTLFAAPAGVDGGAPDFLDVVYGSINIMQDRITRSRLSGEPPFVELTPQTGDVVFWEFHRAAELIAAGERAVADHESKVRQILSPGSEASSSGDRPA